MKLRELAVLLAVFLALPGCLWIPATVAVIVVTTGDDDGGDSPVPAALGVEILPAAGLPEGVGEGQVQFLVTLERPAFEATYDLRFSYEGSDRIVRPCGMMPRVFCRGLGEVLEPVDCRWSIAPGTDRDERIVEWDTAGEGIRYEPSVAFIVEWGPLKAYALRIEVDNTPVPALPEQEIHPIPPACYGEPVRFPLLLGSWGDGTDSGDPSTGSVTLEATLRVLRSSSGLAGEIHLPKVYRILERRDWEAGEVTLEWWSEEQLPDALAEAEVEIVPRQVKYGLPARTEAFKVDNRLPRPVWTDRRRIPSDRAFELTVYGTGFSRDAEVALVKPGTDPLRFFRPVGTVPRDEDPESLEGPNGLTIIFSHEEDLGLKGHRGPVDAVIKNPNCRITRLEGALFLGPSTVSFNGPFYSLSEDPVDVAVGNFVPDPEGSEKPILDVAVITATTPPFVVVLGGDGKGNLPDRWIVPLGDEGATAMALAEVPSCGGGPSGILVATTRSLELVQAEPDAEPVRFRSEVVAGAEILGEEDVRRRSLAVADFDGDRIPDAAVSSFNGSRIDVFTGQEPEGGPGGESPSGGISFGSAPTCSLGEGVFGFPRALAAANFDLDLAWKHDLVVLAEEGGAPTLFLFLSGEDGRLGPEPHAREAFRDAGDCIAASDASSFEDGTQFPHPDILVGLRSDEVTRVFVRWDEASGKLKLDINPRSSSLSGRARDISLIHLPGGALLKKSKRPVIDYATVDAGSGNLSYGYTDDGGDGSENSGNYPLPGEGQALAAGDLDGDGSQDIVAVTSGPPLLGVLLARSPETFEVEQGPFRYPAGGTAGEEPLRTPGALGIGYGDAMAGGGEPFLATVSRVRDEVTVFFLDPETGVLLRVERYGHVGAVAGEPRTGARSLVVADFDGRNGDDIAVAASRVDRVTLLLNLGSGSPRFEEIVILDFLTLNPEILPEVFVGFVGDDEVGFRIIDQAKLDGNDLPDLILPLTIKKYPNPDDPDGAWIDHISDFVAVVLNPGDIPEIVENPPPPDVRFYRTLDDPRHATAADVNGDGVLDILVACENRKSKYLPQQNPVGFYQAEPDMT